MKTLYNIKPFFLLIILGLASCSAAEDSINPADSFVRIYDDNRFEASYDPVDIKQTPAGNYLVLARSTENTSDFQTAYFMVIDKDGNFIAENDFQRELVHPLEDILEINGSFYMVAMNRTSLNTQLVELLETGETGDSVPMGGTIYPLHAAVDGQQIILQSFNSEDKRTIISVLSLNGGILKQQDFDIGPGSETEAPIIQHFTNRASRLPFRVGRLDGGLYYFNGFFNYTFSLVFTNLNDGDPQGVVQGQHDDGGISAIMPLSGQDFAVSSFNFGTNYLMPRLSLNTTGISSAVDLVNNPFPEFEPNAYVRITDASGSNGQVILMASSSRNGQIVLHGFAPSGKLIGSKYLGYGNQNKLASVIQTADGGLAVLGTTYVAGRFERIVLYKLSERESENILNLNLLNTSS